MLRVLLQQACDALLNAESGLWGCAVSHIEYDLSKECWVMHNQEYESHPIVCCPFCGDKLKSPKEEKK